jgi:hypothetical protein
MADEAPQSVDFWSELEEAHQTVEQWPEWQQRYEADVNSEEALSPEPPLTLTLSPEGRGD